MTKQRVKLTRDCVSDIRDIITRARQSVVRHVNSTVMFAYWLIGRRLDVEEQKGKRAAYGKRLLERISRELTAEFGRGFAEPSLPNGRIVLFCGRWTLKDWFQGLEYRK